MIGNDREVTPDVLQEEVKNLFQDGYRLVTATCLDLGESFEIIYHFDKRLDLLNLRMTVPKEAEIPSISSVYLAAFLIENEIKELFGARIAGVAVDYEGRLLVTDGAVRTPMLKTVQVTSVAASPDGGEK